MPAKYKNIPSKLQQRPSTATKRSDLKESKTVAFGSTGSFQKPTGLTTATLANFKKQKRTVSVEMAQIKDDDVKPIIGDKQEYQQENTDTTNKDVHKDFGKVPKYLEKYNQKAEELA